MVYIPSSGIINLRGHNENLNVTSYYSPVLRVTPQKKIKNLLARVQARGLSMLKLNLQVVVVPQQCPTSIVGSDSSYSSSRQITGRL